MKRTGIFVTAGRAWRSAFMAVVRMPLVFLTTLALTLAVHALLPYLALTGTAALPDPVQNDPVAPLLVPRLIAASVLTTVLQSLVLAPLAIAVHRFVLLNDRAFLLPLTPVSRVLRFAGWATAISFAFDLALLLGLMLGSTVARGLLVTTVAQIVAMVVAVRTLLMFPAIAVDMPGREARSSWQQTQGHSWRMFLTLALTLLPFLVALGLLSVKLGPGGLSIDATWTTPMSDAAGVVLTTVGAAAASWLFRNYGPGGGYARESSMLGQA